jgi:hypothetical protein
MIETASQLLIHASIIFTYFHILLNIWFTGTGISVDGYRFKIMISVSIAIAIYFFLSLFGYSFSQMYLALMARLPTHFFIAFGFIPAYFAGWTLAKLVTRATKEIGDHPGVSIFISVSVFSYLVAGEIWLYFINVNGFLISLNQIPVLCFYLGVMIHLVFEPSVFREIDKQPSAVMEIL